MFIKKKEYKNVKSLIENIYYLKSIVGNLMCNVYASCLH